VLYSQERRELYLSFQLFDDDCDGWIGPEDLRRCRFAAVGCVAELPSCDPSFRREMREMGHKLSKVEALQVKPQGPWGGKSGEITIIACGAARLTPMAFFQLLRRTQMGFFQLLLFSMAPALAAVTVKLAISVDNSHTSYINGIQATSGCGHCGLLQSTAPPRAAGSPPGVLAPADLPPAAAAPTGRRRTPPRRPSRSSTSGTRS